MEQDQLIPVEKRPLPEPNPVTRKRHRSQVLRQITIPLIIFVIALIAMVAWFITQQIGTVSDWAMISSILLILPGLLLGLIILLVLVAIIVIATYLLQFLPPYARLTQEAIANVKTQIESGADVSAKPLIQIKSFLAVIDVLLGKK